MPRLTEFNSTLLKELEDVFAETTKHEKALVANRKGIADIVSQLEKGAPAYGPLAVQGMQITNEIRQREHEIGKLKERRNQLLLKIPFFQLSGD